MNLQLVPVEHLGMYFDGSGDYWYIPVVREQLDKTEIGTIPLVGKYISAFTDLLYIRLNKSAEFRHSIFLIIQKSSLVDFKLVESIKSTEKITNIFQKYDDGFEEYRADKSVRVNVVAYFIVKPSTLSRNEWGDDVLGRENYAGSRKSKI